jgi:hypothetical protein
MINETEEDELDRAYIQHEWRRGKDISGKA